VAIGKISIEHDASRGPSAIAELLVIYLYIGLAVTVLYRYGELKTRGLSGPPYSCRIHEWLGDGVLPANLISWCLASLNK